MFKRCFHSTIVKQKNYYDILKVPEGADKRTIKAHYYKLSKKYHPDLNPKNEAAHKMFLEINEAYAVLGNEASKRKYDYDSNNSTSSSEMNGAAKYSRAGAGGGNKQAWHFRNRRAPRSTGTASAQEQAERMKNGQPGFDHSEHFNRHYENEEHRRRERMENAAARRRAAGDETVLPKSAPGMEHLWGRLWRLGVVLSGIAYASTQIMD